MKKNFIYLLVLLFSCFSFINFTNAEEDVSINDIYKLLWVDSMLNDNVDDTQTKTPKELAKEELLKYPKWEKYVKMIDDFIKAKETDMNFLSRISYKVKNFNFSNYHSSDPQKDKTLKAVINYIDKYIDELLGL